jgi:crossover junction endodeoxyribonuclease RusA
MSAITLIIHERPAPQPRVRAYRRGDHAGVYTPDSAAAWKSQVTLAAIPHRGLFTTGPLQLDVEFYLPRPQAHKHDDYVAVKPDLDNLLKSTMDALSNAGVWHDDAQVAAVVMSKRYERANQTVGAVIKLGAL